MQCIYIYYTIYIYADIYILRNEYMHACPNQVLIKKCAHLNMRVQRQLKLRGQIDISQQLPQNEQSIRFRLSFFHFLRNGFEFFHHKHLVTKL